MRNLALAFCLSAVATTVPAAQGFEDRSDLSTTDLARCAAAAMKSGQGIDLYKRWASALDARYRRIHPEMSAAERDRYTSERIVDKRQALNRDGIGTTPAFGRFYDANCRTHQP